MNRRKLTALAATGAIASTVAITASPAYADSRTFVVTLLGGGQVTVTVDVPAGTPVDQITFPGLNLPVVSVQEVTPAPTAAPTVTAPPVVPTPGLTPTPGITPPTAPPGSGEAPQGAPGPGGPQQSSQDTALRRPTGEQGVVPDLATAAAAPSGVPNFFIDKFRIPPFLLPIYQAAGIQYGVRWEVLAAINEVETDYGRNLNVSSAGALGWMQFMPATWRAYGVDANKDGLKDPYNPVDAIFAAARYLKAAGADTDLRRAIFAYNHADWYVDMIMLRARVLGGLPSNFVGSLTGLTQGHFPVAARATYADDLSELERSERHRIIESSPTRRSIDIFSREDAPVIAVNDGRIKSVSKDSVVLEDVFGNEYTYKGLGSVAKLYPAAKADRSETIRVEDEPKPDKAPTQAASAGVTAVTTVTDARREAVAGRTTVKPAAKKPAPATTKTAELPEKERLFANPFRKHATKAGGGAQVLEGKAPEGSFEVFRRSVTSIFGVNTKSEDVELKPLKPGARVVAGTILGRIGKSADGTAPHIGFQIRPAGRGAPQIDPKPILDGWKLLETTAIYRAAGKNPFSSGAAPSIGQVLLMDKAALQRTVLQDPRIEIYPCGREDIQLGQVDRRVLATLEFLSLSGFKPTVTSLRCGHSYLTASGNVSHHSSGNAVDIAKINGIPILGHQGSGSITDIVVQRLTTLQGLMRPAQIISLMTVSDADNTFAMGDHHDHIHVGFTPLYGTNSKRAREIDATLKPDQWIKLVDRLNEIDEPVVPAQPSKYAIEAGPD